MVKRLVVGLSVFLLGGLVGCGNVDLVDTNFTFNKAIIKLQNGEIIEGAVDNWRNYDDGDMVQVEIDGVVYLEHSSNVDLIYDESLDK